ncbi:phage tail protein [Lacticaseibacillus yichunensis]|uniref:Phage tail protein n=1 Tax=Lacticaseibacillus yichunensis TaxID=2486015 RepID=A0ABW4CNX5_9LACO|nr:phage tail protein [Lacticaseibacillus yichunensis]
MSYQVDFKNVDTVGLTSSPVATAFAGLRANEARYFWNKYKVVFTTEPAAERPDLVARVATILKERDLVLPYRPLEVADLTVDGVRWTYVFYENGLAINILYTLAAGGKRAVGFKLTDGIEVPAELADKFKFAHQKSALAGVIRGSFFVIKGTYDD